MKIAKLILLKIFISSYILQVCFCTGSLSTSSFKMNTHFSMKKKDPAAKPATSGASPSASAGAPPKNLSQDDLPEVPVYLQGWVKYFTFTKNPSEKSNKPKFFFKNDAYLEQEKEGGVQEKDKKEGEKPEEDENGKLKIPSETSFYAVVYEDHVNILNSREKGFLKVINKLSLDIVDNIPDDANFKGGVRDLGKFSEGYCFEVNTIEPTEYFMMSEREPVPAKGSEKIWYICAEKEDFKNKLKNVIIKLRLKLQHKVGLWLRKNNPPKQPTIASMVSPAEPEVERADGTHKVKGMLDGYWILLQDWSTCSKKCGGGQQFQHLMCVPPKNGGKPCQGEAVRSKECNKEPCPSVSEASQVLPQKGLGVKMEKPIVKMMPISTRPLRYDKCHLKESDAIFTKNERGLPISESNKRLPSRIVMNDKTVSVYTDETLLTELGTFVLDKTVFKLAENKPNCFILDSDTIKAEFCNIDANSKGNFVEEWNYDFNLFKHQCHTPRKVVALNDKEEKELNEELNKKIESAKMDIIKERTKKIQEKVQESPVSKVEKLQETAMLALKKELNIDELLQKEEYEREEAETRELKAQLESEKKKDECLIKSIKEKQLEDQYNINKAQQDKEINQLREQAKQQILQKRQQVKMKILQMRKRADRKKKLLSGQIQTLRSQVAGELNTWNKEGNMNNCFKPTSSEDDKKKVLKYCNSNFMEASPTKFNECLNINTYCYVCCENEFGDMHVKEREKCYDKCDEVPKEEKKNAGSWQWVESI